MAGFQDGNLINEHTDLTIGAVAGDGDNIDCASCLILFPTNNNDTVSGFVVPNESTGSMKWVLNTDSTNNVVLKDNSTSTVGQRLFTKTGSDFTLAPQQFAAFMFMDSVRVGWWQIT